MGFGVFLGWEILGVNFTSNERASPEWIKNTDAKDQVYESFNLGLRELYYPGAYIT